MTKFLRLSKGICCILEQGVSLVGYPLSLERGRRNELEKIHT